MRPPLAAVLLAGVLVTSGCLGFTGESRPPSDQQALDALDRTRAALADVESYRARSNGSATMTDDDRQVRATLAGRVLVDVAAREMNSTGRLDAPNQPIPGVRRTYVTGFTAYTECRLTGWGRRNLSTSRGWFAYTPIGEQLAVLNRTPVYWRGTERLDGTETAVVVAHPTRRELQAAPGVWSLEPEEPGSGNFRNATLTLWVDTESWRPLQVRRVTVWGPAVPR